MEGLGEPWSSPFLPNLCSLSAKQILGLADERNRHKLRNVIKQLVRPSDLDLLKESVSLEKPLVADVALAAMADSRHLLFYHG